MEPYDPNKPFISIDTETSLLDRLLNAGIPLTRALKYFRDNPEGSALETLKLAAEDVVPFYGTYRNDGDLGDYAKEAVMLGVPMPYIKHPTTGKPIPNNLKEALGNKQWNTTKHNWKYNEHPRKLYIDPNARRQWTRFDDNSSGMSTRARINATAEARTPVDVPAGPYRETNTGSNLVNQGQQAINTNTVRTVGGNNITGALAWQGDMYPPGRSLARLDEAGPYVWDAVPEQREYIRKLNDIINENENKWEYLINKTRTKSPEGTRKVRANAIVPKEDIVSIALTQGRPDIAARVMADDEIRISANPSTPNFNKRFRSYQSIQSAFPEFKDNAKWKDLGNRQVEKELREQFAMLPEDPIIREKFAYHYGVPDLYNDWIANPEYWKEFSDKTSKHRYNREALIKEADRQYQRNIKR